MSGLEAFGLACNVMQAIGFALDMASKCQAIFKTGSPDPTTITRLAHSTQITASLAKSISSARTVTRDQKELLNIAKECLSAMSRLKAEVDKLNRPSAKGRVLTSLRLGLRAKFKEGEINKLEKRMLDYQKVLESGLLLRVCNQNDALQLKMETGFQQLDSTFQRFVEAISRGQTNLQYLMISNHDSIVEVVKAESNAQNDLIISNHDSIVEVIKAESNAQNAVTTAIASEVKKTQAMIKETSLEALVREKRQRMLKSLKYDSMGERFGQVKAAFEGTCGWMIHGIQSAPQNPPFLPRRLFTHLPPTALRPPPGRSWPPFLAHLPPGRSWPNETHGEPDEENLPPVCPHRKKKLSWSCFPCWLESPQHKIYWVQGKAGSGKSTLMKFLVTNPTLWYPQSLDGGQDPLILSHFLWAAGSPRQKSLRGILLNLLYQLLSKDQHVLDHVINTFPDLSLKDVEGDWTLEELERTMVASLKAIATGPKDIATRPKDIATRPNTISTGPKASATRPVFIFLDGLDEFGSSDASVVDDPRTLLDLVARLSTLDNIKMCISSRPEPIFKNKLGGLCSLQLQDLTRSDMEKYAKAELLSNEIIGLENQEKYQLLVNKLCGMADGVFLWTALAVRSLSRGLTNEDDISELYARLEKMPTGLYPLYKDMWERLNEDQYLYRKEAALYFQLIIHWWRMPSHEFDKRCTTFHLLTSLDPSISPPYLNDDTASFPSDLEARCEKLGKRVETRSAGLLEHGVIDGSIDFIHRSALEFLTDTPEGQQIMAHDRSTFSELRSWLLQADVARAYYLMVMKPVESQVFRNGHVVRASTRPGGKALYADSLVQDVHLNWDDSALPGDVQIMLLEACRRIVEVDKHRHITARPWDFAGAYAARGYHNIVIPFVRYPQFSPHKDVIRSRSYLIYLFITSSAKPPHQRSKNDTVLLGTAKVVEAVLAKYPLLEFSEHVSSAIVESCFSNGSGQTLAANERTEVLLLLGALTSLFHIRIEQMKLSKQLEILSKPRKYVENFFQRYPHNEEKVLLQISSYSPVGDNWIIDIEFLGRRTHAALHMTNVVVIECDTAYAAELLTLGHARRGEAGTGENKAAAVTDQDTIWRRAAGLKKTDLRVLAAGLKKTYDFRLQTAPTSVLMLEPATYDDANRVLSKLDNIRLAQDGNSFLIPGLQDSLNEIRERENPLTAGKYLKLANANSFNNFALGFMTSFKNLTCSAQHLPWLAEYGQKKEELMLRSGEWVKQHVSDDTWWR